MPRTVPIAIFNTARTEVDRAEVRRWLDHIGATGFEIPPEDAVSDPALLVALAAKRCYMSFEPGLNPNVNKVRTDIAEYLDNVLASGHGCYDSETDVLTLAGWKSWVDVGCEDELATLMPDGTFEYRRPLRVIHTTHGGSMYRVDSDGVNLLVTPDHNMFVCPTTTRKGRSRDRSSYRMVPARELGHTSHAYEKTAVRSRRPDSPFTADDLRFVGFAVGDGYHPGGASSVAFRLRRERKISWLLGLLRRLGWEYKVTGERIRVRPSHSVMSLMGDLYTEGGDKKIPHHSFIFGACGADELDGLYEGLIQSDGHQGRRGDSFCTTSEILAGQFQQLCLHVGVAANVGFVDGKRVGAFGTRPVTVMSVVRRNVRPEVNKWSGCVGRSSWVNDWEGPVHCAEMPADTARAVYVRRNGKPVWCGNSVLEHAVYTFAFEGVSRVFTAEMNRHRAGWAISEASMRFIRFGESIPYWEPDSIRGPDCLTAADAEWVRSWVSGPNPIPRIGDGGIEQKKAMTREVFRQAFASQERAYRVLEAVWAAELAPESKFAGKKAITSMMRRIIGLGCATGGTWTGNLRAVRHVMTLRCEPAAEEEILYVFSAVVKMMAEREPLLCGDFAQDADGYWRPKYKKV